MDWKQLSLAGLTARKEMIIDNEARVAQYGHDYSLLNAVLKKNDEVRLHSRFIFSMINPESLHYQNSLFLKLFLKQLPEAYQNWISFDNASVELEKDNIDLLIHDGDKFLIVENKVDAVDQPYQIVRYIQTIKNRFELSSAELEHKVAIVYLSAKRKYPSTVSKSLIGFIKDGNWIVWQGLDTTKVDLPNKLKNFNLDIGSKLPFFHYAYHRNANKPSLTNWVEDSINSIDDERLKFALSEYKQIIKRLEPNLNWKNKMTFDEYVLNTQDENEQDELYKLMVASSNTLEKYVAKKIYQVIIETFTEEVVNHNGDLKKLDEESLYNWLVKKGSKDKYKNIGFTFNSQNKIYQFVFGISYVYCLPIKEEPKQEQNCLCNTKIRPLVLEKGGLDSVIKAIRKWRDLFSSVN